MSSAQVGAVLRYLRRLAVAKSDEELPDHELLERFTSRQDELAYATLLKRHGPMVLSVCRSVLHDPHDVEDAFQAAFVILAQKAGSIHRHQAVSSWLYRVAYHLAIKARARAARRRVQERKAVPMPVADPLLDMNLRELRTVLYEELERLPEKYRAPLVLCYLEEKTQEEAARLLGWTKGGVKGRLERGRDKLRARLAQRGLELSLGLFATALTQKSAAATVCSTLTDATLKAALAAAAGKTIAAGGMLSADAAALVQAISKSMFWSKVKSIAVLALVSGLAIAGAGITAREVFTAQQPKQERPRREGEAPAEPRTAQAIPSKPDNPARTDRYGDPLPEGAIMRLGTVRLRQGFGLHTVAFSPDGKMIAAGGPGRALGLWDATTGKEIRQFPQKGQPLQVAFSPDGKILAAAWSDASLWDVASGKLLRPLEGNLGGRSVAFSPDGKMVATGSNSNVAFLFETATGKEIRRFLGHERCVQRVAFSPDGKLLATASEDETVRLWDVASGQPLQRLVGHKDMVFPLAFSPDGKMLASGSHDQTIRIWEVSTGKERLVLGGKVGHVAGLVFFRDGRTLASGNGDGTIHLWDVATGKEIRQWQAHWAGIWSLALSANEKVLASASSGESRVRLWDPATGKEILPLGGHSATVMLVSFSADGKTLLSAGREKTIRFWDLATGEQKRLVAWQFPTFQHLALSHDRRILATGAFGDSSVRLWDIETEKEICLLGKHGGWVMSLAFSPDGKLLASGAKDGTVILWDVPGQKELRKIEDLLGKGSVTGLAFSPDGKSLATGSGELDGGFGAKSSLWLWDVATGKERRRFDLHQNVGPIVFSPDGKLLACGGEDPRDPTVRLWEIATGKELRQLRGHQEPIGAIVFSSTGRFLASASAFLGGDSTIRLWETATGKEVRTFSGHHSGIVALAFSPDDRTLASGAGDSTILLWDLIGKAHGLQPVGLDAKELESAWADLAGSDAPKAYEAIWTLVSSPAKTLPFLRDHLRPAAPADPKVVAGLIADLDNDSFNARERAFAELMKLGSLAEPALRKTLKGKPSAELRQRAERLLEEIAVSAEIRRIMEVLEQIGTPEALELLKDLCKGTPEARLTQEAKATLERLAKRTAGTP